MIKNNKIIDVASGTGDIAKLCSNSTNNNCYITCVEPNEKMLEDRYLNLCVINNLKHNKIVSDTVDVEKHSTLALSLIHI